MKPFVLAAVCIAIGSLGGVPHARAQADESRVGCTIYVDRAATYGTDAPGPDGSAARPWMSIAAATAATAPGSVVCIRPGVYYETIEPRHSHVTYRELSRPGSFDVVVSGLDENAFVPGGTGMWEPVGNNVWRALWPQGRYGDDPQGNTDWFVAFDPYVAGSNDPGPENAFGRELLVARSAAPPLGSVADPAYFDGHVMRPVGARADLDGTFGTWANNDGLGTYGAFYVERLPRSGRVDARMRPALGRPYAIYARFPGNQPPSTAQPRLALRNAGLRPRLLSGEAATPEQCGRPERPAGHPYGPFVGTVGHLTVEGIAFRHFNNAAQRGAVCPGSQGSTLRRVAAEFNNGGGIHSGNHPGVDEETATGPPPDATGGSHTFVGVRASYNGQMGMGGECDRCLLADSEVSRNNWKDVNFGWEAGGTKFSYTEDMIVRRVRAMHNNGPGIWFDIANRDNTIEGSWAHANNLVGIFVELYSVRTLVQHNIVSGTLRRPENRRDGDGNARVNNFFGAGIGIQDAPFTYVYHNTSVNNEGAGLYFNTTSRVVGVNRGVPYDFPESQWQGSRGLSVNNVLVGNALVSPTVPYNKEAREVQINEAYSIGTSRDSRFFGNVYLGQYPPNPQGRAGFALYHDVREGATSGGNTGNTNIEWKGLLGLDPTLPPNIEAVRSFATQADRTNLYPVEQWSRWPTLLGTASSDRRLDLPEVPHRDSPGSRRQGYCFGLNGANPAAVLGTAFLDGPGQSNCPSPGTAAAEFVTADRTLTPADEANLAGREIFVADGVTLTISGTVTLRPDADGIVAVLHLGGARLAGAASARIRVLGGSRIEVAPASRTDAFLGAVTLSGSRPLAPNQTEAQRIRSRVVVQPGAELAVRSFVEAEDGATLDLRGGLHLAPGARVTLGASAWPATVRPGTLVRMAEASRVQFLAPGQAVHGTATAPVVFERAGSTPFEEVVFGGALASLRHVHATGGVSNLVVSGTGSVLDDVVSTDAQEVALTIRTVPSLLVQAPGPTLDDDREARWVSVARGRFATSPIGVMVHAASGVHLDDNLLHDNIFGLALTNGQVSRFQRNRIEGSGKYGLALSAESSLSVGTGAGPSYNRITGSASAEILVESGSTFFLGRSGKNGAVGGTNTVADDAGGTLVWNDDKRTAGADFTWWGGPLDPSRIVGAVSALFPLAADPGLPSSPRGGSPEEILADAAEALAKLPVTSAHEGAVRDLLVPALVGEGATRADARALLSAWARPSWDPAVVSDPARAAAATAAGLVRARLWLAALAPDSAQAVLDAVPTPNRDAVRVERWHMTASIAEADGRFADALAALDAADAIALPRPPEDARLARMANGRAVAGVDPARMALASAARQAEASSDAQLRSTPEVLPTALRVQAPWPNPSRGQAVRVSVDVPAAGVLRVSVHDALGREVLVLHDGWASAGRVEASVASRSLASGVYVVRAQGGRSAHAARMTVLR